MKILKKVVNKCLFPGPAVVIISVPVAAVLLLYTFLVAGEESPAAYIAYVVSAYSLTIVCVNVVPLIRRVRRWFQAQPIVRRFLGDTSLKIKASLLCSMGINLLYSGVNAFSGIYYRSVWFGTLAVYYICLSVMRVTLVRYSYRSGFGQNQAAEWRRYRLCGIVLTMMNMSLAGVVILVISQNRGFHYGGYLIYIMAMYAFYVTIMAVVNLVRYRKYRSPVISASRAVNLAAALVSMLSLETAMLTQFDTGSNMPYFRQIMVGTTGGAVCFIVVVMGIYMSVHAAKQLKIENRNLKG